VKREPIFGMQRGAAGPTARTTIDSSFTQDDIGVTVTGLTWSGGVIGAAQTLDLIAPDGTFAGKYYVDAVDTNAHTVSLSLLVTAAIGLGETVPAGCYALASGSPGADGAAAPGPFTLGAFTQPAVGATVSGVTYTGTALPVGVSIIAVIGTDIVGYYTIASSAGTVSLTLDTISAYSPAASVPSGAVVYTATSQAARIIYGGTNDWDGTPGEVATALDRIARALAGLLGGPIP